MPTLAPNHAVSVLTGPTCATCQEDDLFRQAPLASDLARECPDCGTQYRWFQMGSPDGIVEFPVPEHSCASCGVHFLADDDRPFCGDCELSDCTYCGATRNRPLLSENLACELCEGVAA